MKVITEINNGNNIIIYPYLATDNNGDYIMFIGSGKGIWLTEDAGNESFTSIPESKFTPLPKGSKITLIQE